MTKPQKTADDDKIGLEAGKAAFQRLQDELNRRPGVNGNYLRKLATRIDQGVDAKESKFFAHQGKVETTKHVIDYRTRGLYVKLATEVFGAVAPQKHQHEGQDGGPILFIHASRDRKAGDDKR